MRVSFSRFWRWLSRRPHPAGPEPAPPPREWTATWLTLEDATELLDLLERRGARVLEVNVDTDARVTVRWMA
jgi:hypothetical protein